MTDQSLTQPEVAPPGPADAAAPSEFRGLMYPLGRWKPEPQSPHEIAPGVFWLRMPLPFALDHINLWLLEDGDSWVVVDTGLGVPGCQEVWRAVLSGPLIAGKPVSRIFVTHYHPDHIGLAGWLAGETGAPLLMSRTDYLMASFLMLGALPAPPEGVQAFYARAGWPSDSIDRFARRGWGLFARAVTPLPVGYTRLQHGQVHRIGGAAWRIHVGRGHAPEHCCLVSDERGILISGDQVLPRITSNVSVYPMEPHEDPLGDWLDSLEDLLTLPDSLLVLPSHNEPFQGLHARVRQLQADHADKLARVAAFCREAPRTAVECFPALFGRVLTDNDIMMGSGEAFAHINHLVRQGRLDRTTEIRDGREVDLFAG